MLQTEIAKYATWLFGHSVRPAEQLPELYDLLCRKNPIGSEALDYREFEVLFQQWQWQQMHGEDAPQPDPVVNAPKPAIAAEPASAAIDYHVATEFLIEDLIASVKQLLAEGWQPLGGIAQSSSAAGVNYWAQALVKSEP